MLCQPVSVGNNLRKLYSSGEVQIINQSIIDAGTNINVSLEDQQDYSTMRKTMLGVNWEYDFSKNFVIGGTLLKVNEKPQTPKVAMGSEPLNNMLWGFHMNWKQNSQWLTNMLDKLPFLALSAPSSISFTGEYAQLDAGEAKGTQANASYLDDFEYKKLPHDVSNPKEWTLASTPSHLEYGKLTKELSPPSPLGKDCLFAFVVGGLICTLGQGLMNLYQNLGVDKTVAMPVNKHHIDSVGMGKICFKARFDVALEIFFDPDCRQRGGQLLQCRPCRSPDRNAAGGR